jgi:hypothetical protein
VGVRSADPQARARQLAAGFADERGVHTIELDERDVIASAGPDGRNVLGVDLDDLVGHPVSEVVARFSARFGPVQQVTSAVPAPQVEQHDLSYGDPGSTTTIRSVIALGSDGRSTCFLAAQSAPA